MIPTAELQQLVEQYMRPLLQQIEQAPHVEQYMHPLLQQIEQTPCVEQQATQIAKCEFVVEKEYYSDTKVKVTIKFLDNNNQPVQPPGALYSLVVVTDGDDQQRTKHPWIDRPEAVSKNLGEFECTVKFSVLGKQRLQVCGPDPAVSFLSDPFVVTSRRMRCVHNKRRRANRESPIKDLDGVGRSIAQQLQKVGVETIGDLASINNEKREKIIKNGPLRSSIRLQIDRLIESAKAKCSEDNNEAHHTMHSTQQSPQVGGSPPPPPPPPLHTDDPFLLASRTEEEAPHGGWDCFLPDPPPPLDASFSELCQLVSVQGNPSVNLNNISGDPSRGSNTRLKPNATVATPLHAAVLSKDPQAVQQCISSQRNHHKKYRHSGANFVLDVFNGNGLTPLMLACVVGATAAVRVLANEQVVDVNKKMMKNKTQLTPLELCVVCQRDECARVLIESGKVNEEVRNRAGRLCLLTGAVNIHKLLLSACVESA